MRRTTTGMIVAEVLMLALCALMLLPFYYLLVNTFKSPQEAAFRPMSLPTRIYLGNYVKAFNKMRFFSSFTNTAVISFTSAVFVIVFGAMAAYPVARRSHAVFRVIMLYFLLGFMVPVQTTLVPLFLIMQKLHLVNRITGIIVLYSGGSTFAFFLFRGFVRMTPRELEESATIDGCSLWRMFWTILFPLLKPVTVTIAIFHVVGAWNDFILPFLFLSSRRVSTLTLEIYRSVGEFTRDWPVMMSTVAIILLPMVVFYLAAQKHIISGLTAGAIKG